MEKIFIGIAMMSIGVLFAINGNNMAKGSAMFYQKFLGWIPFYKKFYTEDNLKVIYKVLSVFLIIVGLVIIFRG